MSDGQNVYYNYLDPRKDAHAPGPWSVCDNDGFTALISSEAGVIAVTSACAEHDANANLIAAAPEMYQALQAVRIAMKNRDREPHEEKLYQLVHLTLAKAEGA